MDNKEEKNINSEEIDSTELKKEDADYEEIEDTEEVEDVDEEESTSFRMDQDEFRSKMLKLFGIVFVVLIAILLIGFIVSLFTKKNYTYSAVEDVMKNAAKSYFNENPKKLPKAKNEIVQINVDLLVEEKKMKSLDHYLKGKSCKGNVEVEKISTTEYDYNPYLNCGKDYETTTFYEALKKKENIVNDGYGLYYYNNEYVFRGKDVNNYVKFSDSDNLYRVVKITNTNEVVLIQDEVSKNRYAWDERYNQTYDDNIGINVYKNSLISDIIDYYYKGKIGKENSDKYDDYDYNEEKIVLTKEDRKKTVEFKACVGRRSENDTSKDGSTDCDVTYNTKMALLPVYDFLNASIDPNCTTTVSPSCQNYNYLADDTRIWLANGSKEHSGKVYMIAVNYLDSRKASEEAFIKPIIHLSDKTMLEKGKGTKNNPYVIR